MKPSNQWNRKQQARCDSTRTCLATHALGHPPSCRVILAYFRGRALRTDGAAALAAWRAAAAAAAACRRALTFRWNGLLVRAFGAWLIAREHARMGRATVHYKTKLARKALLHAWPEGAALQQRHRSLEVAAATMAADRRLGRALAAWGVFAAARRQELVVLHWRARRLGCLTLRCWSAVSELFACGTSQRLGRRSRTTCQVVVMTQCFHAALSSSSMICSKQDPAFVVHSQPHCVLPPCVCPLLPQFIDRWLPSWQRTGSMSQSWPSSLPPQPQPRPSHDGRPSRAPAATGGARWRCVRCRPGARGQLCARRRARWCERRWWRWRGAGWSGCSSLGGGTRR
jgi:hypothetical protein